jgi:hypothetical protein
MPVLEKSIPNRKKKQQITETEMICIYSGAKCKPVKLEYTIRGWWRETESEVP